MQVLSGLSPIQFAPPFSAMGNFCATCGLATAAHWALCTSAFGIMMCCRERALPGLLLGPLEDPATTLLTMRTSVRIYSDFAFVLLAEFFNVCYLVALVFCYFPRPRG